MSRDDDDPFAGEPVRDFAVPHRGKAPPYPSRRCQEF
jgi:hypothetical protein